MEFLVYSSVLLKDTIEDLVLLLLTCMVSEDTSDLTFIFGPLYLIRNF